MVSMYDEDYGEFIRDLAEALGNHFDISDEQAKDAIDAILPVMRDYGAVE